MANNIKMNIFFIPSWYPSKTNRIAGHFIKEQALILGKYSNFKIIISLWGDEETKLNFEYPGQVLPHLSNYFQNKPYQRKIARNVWEFNQPALEWSARFFKGNIESIIKANICNFEKAQKKIGEIDLIHGHVSFPAGLVAMKLAQKYNIPYIITEHMGPFPLEPFSGRKRLLPLVLEPLKKANLVIAVSRKLQSELQEYQIKSVVVPNLIDGNYFKLVPKKESQNFSLFTLGEISAEKGFEDLIRALALAANKDRHLILRIGGKGKFLKKYQHLADELKIGQNIIWLGYLSRSQVLQEMQRCDTFILPSHHESFGMVFLEALACGRPVIATRCGGPEDFVTKENGILVDVGNIGAIASAVIRLKHNIGRFEPKNIRKKILQKYSSEVIAKKLIKLYQNFT